jgi:exopolysaccharide biosynthesis protein
MTQLKWQNVDSLFQPLPTSVHVYFTNDSLDGKPNRAYYVSAALEDKQLNFTVDTGYEKRYTPTQFFERNQQALVVVNCTFFEFVHNRNLNLVVQNKKIVAYNNPANFGRGKDTFTYTHAFASAIGINHQRKADVAWTYTDSSLKTPYASQVAIPAIKDSVQLPSFQQLQKELATKNISPSFQKWKMQTVVGGGPVLIQNGNIQISNNEELKFSGKAIADKHPRTAMGYTQNGQFIVMVIEGRFPGKAEGASLIQEANLLKQVGCVEALNLDGGGSSCLLINGKQTITPSDKEGQRPVPAVFLIKQNNH